MPIDPDLPFRAINIAVLTVSDTRGLAEDRSGDTLVARLEGAGHRLADRVILRDDIEGIVAQLERWIDDPAIDCVITTGGTGVTGRDVTPEAVERVATKMIPGFGELFRHLSFAKIGTSTVQSRACACVAARLPRRLRALRLLAPRLPSTASPRRLRTLCWRRHRSSRGTPTSTPSMWCPL